MLWPESIARAVCSTCCEGAECSRRILLAWICLGIGTLGLSVQAQEDSLQIRGENQTVHVFGARGSGPTAIISSGDAGWFGLGPKVADFLSQQGYFVVGFSSKAYLESFTNKGSHLGMADVSKDYATLVDWAAQGGKDKPILIGVSEGAGLSVLAASGPELKGKIVGVLALGLPQENELAWRTRDAIIWFTKKVRKEPTFQVKDVIAQVGPVPLAVIHSTGDEFVSVEDERKLFELAKDPKKLWVLTAKNHSFKGNHSELDQTILEAIAWMRQAH